MSKPEPSEYPAMGNKKNNLYKELIKGGGTLCTRNKEGIIDIKLHDETINAINKAHGTKFSRRRPLKLKIRYIRKPRLVKLTLTGSGGTLNFNIRRRLWDKAFIERALVKRLIEKNEALCIIRRASY